jgi:xanthine dehydrogenase YagR molybdenum-binding subunit
MPPDTAIQPPTQPAQPQPGAQPLPPPPPPVAPWHNPATVMGKPAPRLDGVAKVTGAAKYTYDVQPNGLLYGMILRSKLPASKVTRIDLSKAQAMPGVKAAILAEGEQRAVRYYGQELAAVAATTKQQCQDALRAIVVESTPLPFVVNEDDAMKPDAAMVFDTAPNVSQPSLKEEGHVDQAMAGAAAVVQAELRTQVQLHHPLETHGNTVSVEGDHVTAWTGRLGGGAAGEHRGHLRLHGRRLRLQVWPGQARRPRHEIIQGRRRAGEADAAASRPGARRRQSPLVHPEPEIRGG